MALESTTDTTPDVTTELDVLSRELDVLWSQSVARYRVRARVIAARLLGDINDSACARWFCLVAGEFLCVDHEWFTAVTLLPQLATAAARASERRPAPGAAPFPGQRPEPYWSTWPSVNPPPPLERDTRALRCDRQPAWATARYDGPAWQVMYELLTRMTHIGDFATMELHPVPEVDPRILADEHATLDFSPPRAGENRPPMGLAVATLLVRQLAYEYASEFGDHEIAGWMFSTMTQSPPIHEIRAPEWATPDIAAALATLDPSGVLALCETVVLDLDRRYAEL